MFKQIIQINLTSETMLKQHTAEAERRVYVQVLYYTFGVGEARPMRLYIYRLKDNRIHMLGFRV